MRSSSAHLWEDKYSEREENDSEGENETEKDEYHEDSEEFDIDDDRERLSNLDEIFVYISEMYSICNYYLPPVFGNEESRKKKKKSHFDERVAKNPQSNNISNYQPTEKFLKKFANKINVEKYEGPQLPVNVANRLMESNRRFEENRLI